MIDLDMIRGFFPGTVRNVGTFDKYMLKEYVQLLILDYISTSVYADRLCFIGGTNLRLVYGLDRFSEDLDFDCRDMSAEDFRSLTDGVLAFLRLSDFNAEARDRENPKLKAFRRNIYFPNLLFELNISAFRDERFLIKIEAQDQGVAYSPEIADVKGCGFFFPIQVPPKKVLCAMKLSALVTRAKGRDFYDSMFLLSQTEPDYEFLKARTGIGSREELKSALIRLCRDTDLVKKSRDFAHLLFNPARSDSVLRFREFVDTFSI